MSLIPNICVAPTFPDNALGTGFEINVGYEGEATRCSLQEPANLCFGEATHANKAAPQRGRRPPHGFYTVMVEPSAEIKLHCWVKVVPRAFVIFFKRSSRNSGTPVKWLPI
jgi:hypothetical protein